MRMTTNLVDGHRPFTEEEGGKDHSAVWSDGLSEAHTAMIPKAEDDATLCFLFCSPIVGLSCLFAFG